MAKPVSDEEQQLRKRARRRLIGAIALVATVAVVLPMILDSEPKPTSQEINIRIPSPDAKGFTSKVVPIPAPPAKGAAEGQPEATTDKPAGPAADALAAKALPDVASKAATTVPQTAPDAAIAAKPAITPAPEKTAAKAPEKAPEKAAEKASTPKPGTFFIQVTALADPERAKQVQQRIIDAGFPTYTQVIPAGKGSVTRVRAGPFATRDEADKAQVALQGAGFEGKVAASQ